LKQLKQERDRVEISNGPIAVVSHVTTRTPCSYRAGASGREWEAASD